MDTIRTEMTAIAMIAVADLSQGNVEELLV